MKIITVAAQKGGTAKTTTAAALAQGATGKALLIDLDPQGSLTHIIGAKGTREGSYGLMRGQDAGELIQHVEGQPDIIPASRYLASADAELAGKTNGLKAGLKNLKGYDAVIIDTPPAMGTILISALTATSGVIIPLQADTFAVQGLYQLTDTIQRVKERLNPALEITGAILTRYSAHTILARDLTKAIRAKCAELGVPLLSTTIRDGVAVKEAQALQANLFDYAPKSKPAKDYAALIKELEV